MTIGSISGQNLAEAKRIIKVVDRAAQDLAAVDDRPGIDITDGKGAVRVKNYLQDPDTGRTYSGAYTYDSKTGEKSRLSVDLRGDLYDDPDFLGVHYDFGRTTREDVYIRTDGQDSSLKYIEEARVNRQSGEISYRAYKEDHNHPPDPPFPPFPPFPPGPPIPPKLL